MATTPKTKTPTETPDETPAAKRKAAPKRNHVLYRPDPDGARSFLDVVVFGDQGKALLNLATVHTGQDGWSYIELAPGASLAEAIKIAEDA